MLGFVQAEGLCEFGEVLAGVVKVYDVDGRGKMGCGGGFILAGPDGGGDDLLGALATPANGLLIYVHAEKCAQFDGCDIGGGVGIAHRSTFRVGADLGEYAAEFDLAGFGGFWRCHRRPCP